jgi:Flp pilus assembly protein TadG
MAKINERQSERGQSMVEIALTLPILILLLGGLLDLGRVYFTQVALEDSVGEAALYLSINPACRYASDGAACADPNNAYYRAKNSVGAEVDWTRVSIAFERPDVYGVGDPVKVTIRYPFDLMTPILPKALKMNQLNLLTAATQMIVTE